MAKLKCPGCNRVGTYSAKFGQCSACKLGYNLSAGFTDAGQSADVTKDVTGAVTKVTPVVTEPEIVTNNVTEVTPTVTRHCPTCACVKRTNAERQRAYRERKRG